MLTIEIPSDHMIIIKKIIVKRKEGVDLLVCRRIVLALRNYVSGVELVAREGRASGNNALEVMSLALFNGDYVVVKAEGEDAQDAFSAVSRLLVD